MIHELLAECYRLAEDTYFEVDGIPVSVEQARELFRKNPFQFEHWAVERIGGFPTKKTGDQGIDGRIYFETKEGLQSMVLSVKGSKFRPADIRDLRGVMERGPDPEMTGFLFLNMPTKAMYSEADKASQ